MYLDSSLTVNEPFMYKVEEQLVECIATRMILPQFIEHRAQHLKGRHSSERKAERQGKGRRRSDPGFNVRSQRITENSTFNNMCVLV